jgi:cobalt/nickel transport system ATP-binding protein
MSRPIICVTNLRYRYPSGTLALDGINFEQNRGETVVLLGPNGSGKTTFALHLNGTIGKDTVNNADGVVEICGNAITQGDLFARQKVGFLFQDPNDQLFMPTVLEDVCFGLFNLRVDGQPLSESVCLERARSVLGQLEIDHLAQRIPHELSTGEKQKVALAGIVVLDPEILVLDEPSAALDPPGTRLLIRLISGLPQTKLVITHDTRLAESVAERAVFFQRGRIISDGSVEQVLQEADWL